MSSSSSKTLILIDKPAGISSFDVIRRLRKKWSIRHPRRPTPRMGHSGTLDPFATGLMLIGVGEGTKKLKDYIKLDKTYEAEVVLGRSTETGDLTGETIREVEVRDVKKEEVERVLEGMVGDMELSVPRYSAIKVDGKRLYKRARAGEDFEPPKKKMCVLRAELQDIKKEDTFVVLNVVFEVGSGTYVRSLGEELGRRLGYPAMLRNLRRTRVGIYSVLDAETI